MFCCTKLVVRDCPNCFTGDITHRANPSSSTTDTKAITNTSSRESELQIREEKLSKRQQDIENNEKRLKQELKEKEDRLKSNTSSDVTEVTANVYPEGIFTGFVKGSQKYKGTLVYHADDTKKRKEYHGDFLNGNPNKASSSSSSLSPSSSSLLSLLSSLSLSLSSSS
jgi:hypothetical protein